MIRHVVLFGILLITLALIVLNWYFFFRPEPYIVPVPFPQSIEEMQTPPDMELPMCIEEGGVTTCYEGPKG